MNQPLSDAIETGLDNIFESTPLALLQPRTAIAWQLRSKTVLQSGFGLFSDLLPGSVVDLVGANPPYSQTFQGGLLGTVGGTTIAPGAANSAVDATITANQIFNTGFATNQLSCASPLAVPNSCLQPVAMTAVPDGRLHAPYFMQWSFGLEQQIGNTIHLRAQYVGTRAVNQHFTTQVNGNFRWSDFYLTKWFTLSERAKLRIDGQFFNLFNHPNFGLPVLGYAGTPGRPSTQTGFGALSFTTSPPRTYWASG